MFQDTRLPSPDTLKQPATWSHVELSTALICACLPLMRPLLTAFLNLIGLNQGGSQNSRSAPQHGTVEVSIPATKSIRKKSGVAALTGILEFEVTDDSWTALPTIEAKGSDELPINSPPRIPVNRIHISKQYVQKVEIRPKVDDGWYAGRWKGSWYPGS